MLAKKCDRCNKYYDEYTEVDGIVYNSIVFYRRKFGIDTEIPEDFAYKPKDLCKDCLKSLIEWYGSEDIYL